MLIQFTHNNLLLFYVCRIINVKKQGNVNVEKLENASLTLSEHILRVICLFLEITNIIIKDYVKNKVLDTNYSFINHWIKLISYMYKATNKSVIFVLWFITDTKFKARYKNKTFITKFV